MMVCDCCGAFYPTHWQANFALVASYAELLSTAGHIGIVGRYGETPVDSARDPFKHCFLYGMYYERFIREIADRIM